MSDYQKIYGYFKFKSKKYAFAIDGSVGRIFHCFSQTSSEKPTLPDVLYGVTEQNHDIAVHIGSWKQNSNSIVFFADFYALGSASSVHYDLSRFNRIEFVGGVGNSILSPALIYPQFDCQEKIFEEGYSIKYKPTQDIDKQYRLTVHGTPLTFQSTVTPCRNRADNRLGTVNSVIALKFDESQPFDTIGKWCSYITKMSALLTGRQQVAFETVAVFCRENGRYDHANVIFHDGRGQTSVKESLRAISLRSVDRVFSSFSRIVEAKGFSTDFLRQSDTAYCPNYESITAICRALEYEYANSSVKDGDGVLHDAIVQAQQLLLEYKNRASQFSEQTYNVINDNISSWTRSTTEQISCLYEANRSAVDSLAKGRIGGLSEGSLHNFVACRDMIANGDKPLLHGGIFDTAHCLKILLYVSLFKRMELTEEETVNALMPMFEQDNG